MSSRQCACFPSRSLNPCSSCAATQNHGLHRRQHDIEWLISSASTCRRAKTASSPPIHCSRFVSCCREHTWKCQVSPPAFPRIIARYSATGGLLPMERLLSAVTQNCSAEKRFSCFMDRRRWLQLP